MEIRLAWNSVYLWLGFKVWATMPSLGSYLMKAYLMAKDKKTKNVFRDGTGSMWSTVTFKIFPLYTDS